MIESGAPAGLLVNHVAGRRGSRSCTQFTTKRKFSNFLVKVSHFLAYNFQTLLFFLALTKTQPPVIGHSFFEKFLPVSNKIQAHIFLLSYF